MIIDRVFLDANILFSVAYGSPGLKRLWKWAQEGHCLLFVSQYVIEEAKRNLVETSHFKRLQSCIARAQVVPEVDPQVPCPMNLPKKDQPVLLSAISARADYLLAGDATHFGPYFGQTVHGVKILPPADYFAARERWMR
jgi:predicted nucleic acid-binding protein